MGLGRVRGIIEKKKKNLGGGGGGTIEYYDMIRYDI